MPNLLAVCDSFNFSKPELWLEWIQNFEHLIADFNLESDKERIELLFYTMGSIAKELMTELKPNFEKDMSYEEVKTEFTKYFTVKKHVIVERQKFNNRVKLPNETIDAFTTDLLKLVSKCEYGPLENYMLRRRIFVGIGYNETSALIDAMPNFTLKEPISTEKEEKIQEDSISIENRLTEN